MQALCDLSHQKEPTRQLLRRLFPTTNDLLRHEGDSTFSTSHQGVGSAPNVSEAAFFNRFFRFAIGPEEWSQREARKILNQCSNRIEFVEIWRNVSLGKFRPQSSGEISSNETYQERDDGSQQRLYELVEILHRQIRNLPPAHSEEQFTRIQNILTALFDVGDILPEGWGGKWIASNLEEPVSDAAFAALCQIEDSGKRRQVLLASLSETSGWTVKAWFVLREIQRHEGSQRDYYLKLNQFCLSDSDLVCAKQDCLARIELAAETGELWNRPKAKNLIYLWQEWADEAAAKRLKIALGKKISTSEGTYSLLQSFLGTTHSSTLIDGENQTWRSWVVDLVEIGRFIPLGRVESRIETLHRDLTKQIETVALMLPSHANASQIEPNLRLRWFCLSVCTYAFDQHNSGRTNMVGWKKTEHELDEELNQLLARTQAKQAVRH